MIRNKLKLQAGKTYTVNDASSTYTIIVGDVSEADSGAGSPTPESYSFFNIGAGSPSLNLGRIGSVYLDSVNKTLYTKDAIGWDSGFAMGGSDGSSEFKVGMGAPSLSLSSSINAYIDMQSMTFHTRSGGSWDEGRLMRGSSGQNGKSVRFGSGPPIASLGADDEAYIDLNDFKIHTKTAGSWSSGQAFKGSNGQNGLNGKSLRFGNGLPSDSDGDDNEVYLDLSNFKIHSKSAGSWGSGAEFKGSRGNDGQNGKSVRFGNGAPAASLGDDDETYIDLDSFKIHSKSAGSWGSGHVFKGSDGAHGLNGKSIKFGNGAPSDADGDDDEVYLDLSNFKVHTKATGSWGSGLAFKGSNGDKGTDGQPGSDGKHGISAQLTNDSDVISADSDGSGYDFTDTGGEFEIRSGGAKVSSGVTYYAGTSGTNTTSTVSGLTLTINSSGVYSLSGASWTQNFARFTMRAIHDGVTYTKVYKVTKARSGVAGINGVNGSNGLPGNNGKDGADGATGPKGDTGNAGSNGTGIYSTTLIAESGTPSSNTAYGTIGADDLLIDSTNHKIYKRSASGTTFAWALQGTQFKGAAGATGPAAITGYLSNESHTVTANPDGTGFSLAGAGGTFYVNSGSSTVTAQNYYVGAVGTSTSAIQNKLTLSINSSGAYTLSGASWDSDSESFTLRAISGGTTVTKSYSIVKNKSSKNLSLVASSLTFSKNGAGSFYPSGQSITLTPQMQNLSSTTITWTVKKIISGTPTTLSLPNVGYITLTAGSSPYATLTSTQFNSATGGVVGAQLQITAAHADGVEDTVTIGVVSDGSETDIYCAALGTAGSATDQRVPYDTTRGGGTGLRISDLKADVGGIITATEGSVVNYVSAFAPLGDSLKPSASYTFNYSVGPTNYSTTINHRADGEDLDYTPTIFTVAVAGQYRITWQGSFKLRNYDPSSTKSATCYISMLKAPAGSSNYDVIDEASVSLSCVAAGTSKTATKFTVGGSSSTATLLDVSITPAAVQLYTIKNYVGRYYPDYEYVNKVTTLNLQIGDKIIFKARKGSYSLISYDPDTIDGDNSTIYAAKYRDATEAWINANSASDDETDKDIDTIVMFQRVAD